MKLPAREDSSAKNPNQPNEDQVNRYDIVQDARHDQDQDSGNQGKERSGQGVMNRYSSTTGLNTRQVRERLRESSVGRRHNGGPKVGF